MRLAEYLSVDTERNKKIKIRWKRNETGKWVWRDAILQRTRNINVFEVWRKRGGSVAKRPPSVDTKRNKNLDLVEAQRKWEMDLAERFPTVEVERKEI